MPFIGRLAPVDCAFLRKDICAPSHDIQRPVLLMLQVRRYFHADGNMQSHEYNIAARQPASAMPRHAATAFQAAVTTFLLFISKFTAKR